MKKIFVGLILLFLTCIAFAEAPAKRTANSVVIDGTVNGKKAKDNFRIINKSNVSSYLISIYGFNSKTGVWDFAGNCLVKKQSETYAIDSKINLRNYTYFSVESEEIQNFNYSLNIKHDDLYITLNDGESTGKAPNYTQYQKVIQMPNFSKD